MFFDLRYSIKRIPHNSGVLHDFVATLNGDALGSSWCREYIIQFNERS